MYRNINCQNTSYSMRDLTKRLAAIARATCTVRYQQPTARYGRLRKRMRNSGDFEEARFLENLAAYRTSLAIALSPIANGGN